MVNLIVFKPLSQRELTVAFNVLFAMGSRWLMTAASRQITPSWQKNGARIMTKNLVRFLAAQNTRQSGGARIPRIQFTKHQYIVGHTSIPDARFAQEKGLRFLGKSTILTNYQNCNYNVLFSLSAIQSTAVPTLHFL